MSNVVHNYHHATREYLGQGLADESPLEPGVLLIPGNATGIAPPETAIKEMAVFNGASWNVVPDHRGESYWLDGAEFKIGNLGEAPPAGSTPDKPVAAPVPLANVKAQLMDEVDDGIGAIYSRFTRFETEYVQREAAARAFKAGGYQGDAGVWVMSFATNAGMTATIAANLIISQADGMRAALQALGALRMGKYGIAAAASEADAQAVRDGIIAQANAIAASL